MRIGIFLGSFDPLHIGHESVITDALNRHLVDCVFIVPAYKNPCKEKHSVSYDDRLNMCRIAAECINETYVCTKYDNAVYVSDIEKTLANGNFVYTSEVLKKLTEEYPYDNMCILCGTDVANKIHKWHEGQWIVDNYEVIDVGRIGETTETLDKGMKISSTVLRKMLENDENPYPYISKEIYAYIKENMLYSILYEPEPDTRTITENEHLSDTDTRTVI